MRRRVKSQRPDKCQHCQYQSGTEPDTNSDTNAVTGAVRANVPDLSDCCQRHDCLRRQHHERATYRLVQFGNGHVHDHDDVHQRCTVHYVGFHLSIDC